MTSVEWYSEKTLTGRLGITDSAMSQYARALKKSERKKHEGKWFIHATAAEALLKGLGSNGIDISDCALENGQEPAAPALVELTITRIWSNPRLLQATRDDTGESVRVRVPKNVNFQPRMKIKARIPVNGAEGPQPLYILEGRCPRYRGRW